MADSVIRHLRSPIRKDAPKETVDFCKLGELIKLEKMLSGDVSDSVKMTSICRKQVCKPIFIVHLLSNTRRFQSQDDICELSDVLCKVVALDLIYNFAVHRRA